MKIKSLWSYPVKSLLGESLQELNLDLRGVVGDRSYAITNSKGKFGSGKTTRRFIRINNLFSLSASSENGFPSITFPNGDIVRVNSPTINEKLSEYFGQKLTIEKENKISHFDDGAIHIVTTSSLSNLQKLMGSTEKIDERRFRANIIIETPDNLTDNYLIGKTLHIGEVKLEIIKQTERCRMVSLAQFGLEKDKKILKTISQNMELNFGIYAKALNPAIIKVGQKVKII